MDELELSAALKALAVPSRLKIIELLRGHNLCVNALTMQLDISQPAVSQHLSVLKKAGIVEDRKIGTMVHYALDEQRIEDVRKALGDLGREKAGGNE